MAIVRDHTDISASTTTTPLPRGVIAFHIPAIVKWDDMSSMDCSSLKLSILRLLKPEIDGQVVNDRDWLTVECAGAKLPSLDGIERGLIEPHRQRFEDAGIGYIAVAVDDRLDDDNSFDAGF